MSAHTKIPAGYQITVTSWENDGDNYQTNVVSGLSKTDAKFMVEFAKIFGSDDEDTGFGNIPEADEYYYERLAREIMAIVAREQISAPAEIQKALNDADEGDPDDENWFLGIARASYPLYRKMFGNSEFEYRMYESHTVGYIPIDIEIEDVTDEF